MRCVMCNSAKSTGGTVIFGLDRNYRICKRCLKYYIQNLDIEFEDNLSEVRKTVKVRKYIQEKVDEKLNYYLLKV